MSNERNLISDQVITNRAPVRNQDNKHAKKASDGTMSFMVWSITGTALAACSSPIFSDVASIGGGGGRSGDSGVFTLRESESSSGPTSIATAREFASVPADGGVYINPAVAHRPEAQNGPEGADIQTGPGGADIQDAVIMFRRGALDGSDDIALSAATPIERGVPMGEDVPDGFAGGTQGIQDIDSVNFLYVSQANLERLFLSFDDTYQVAADFDINFHVYDSADTDFDTNIADATLREATARTVAVRFEADVDDPATAIALDGAQTVTSIAEANGIDRTKIADLMIVDIDETPLNTLEIVVTDNSLADDVAARIVAMFELGSTTDGTTDGTAIYLREGTNLDFETLTSLPIRVQLVEDSTIGVNISVAVTDVNDVAPMITSGATGGALVEGTEIQADTQVVYAATGDFDVTPIVWSLAEDIGDEDALSINSTTGAVTFDADTTPNHGIKSTYTFTVVATSGSLTPARQSVTINVTDIPDVAPGTGLTVSSEGVRDSVVIYGVEFRQLENLPPLPDNGLVGEKIAFVDRAENDPVTFSTSTAVYIVRTRDFSQADIARIWNTDTTSNSRFVATIIAEMPNIDTYDEWEAMELGGAETGVSNITAGRSFAGYTAEADRVVTEGDDLTASGWLKVTGGTGDIIFGKDATSGVTVTGQLGGASGNADHTDTREYTYAGRYGNLVIDGDGDWVYTLGGTTDQNNALAALASTDTEMDPFTVEVSRGDEMEELEIEITVNGADNLTVTNEAVRAFVIVNGVEFRVNTDGDERTAYEIDFRSTSDAGRVNINNDDLIELRATSTANQFASPSDPHFSQANIARLFNAANLANLEVAAIILEGNTTNALANWDSSEIDTRYDFITASTALDLAVTEDDEADSTAHGFLEVTGGTGSYTYSGDFEGIYGDLIVDGDGNWTYVLDNTDDDTQGLDTGENGTDRFTVTVRETGGAMRTGTETIEIEVNGAKDLVVTNEAVRAFVIVNGVEFRVNTDGNAPGDQADRVFFSATSTLGVNFIGGRIGVWAFDTNGNSDGDYSQANIAGIFKNNPPTRAPGDDRPTYLDVAAIILEEDNTAFTKNSTHNFSTASTTLDDAVTEDDAADSTARGFLQVTDATDADTYTYTGGDTTRDHVYTTEITYTYQIFDGDYGQLIVDGDGNWTYVIDNTRQATQALSSGGTAAIDDFEVIVTQTAGTGTGTPGTAMIDITVNGANDAPVLGDITGARIEDSPDSATGSTVTTGALSGMFTATDADTADTHMFIAAGAGGAGAEEDATLSGFTHRVDGNYGMLFYNGGGVSDAEAAYQYVPNEAAINGLAHEALVTESFEVTVTDGSATSTPRTLAFTIGGANDAPVLGSLLSAEILITDNPDSATDNTVTGPLSGAFTVTDDMDDEHTFSATGGAPDPSRASDGFTHSRNGNYGKLFYNGNRVSDAEAAYQYVPNEVLIDAVIGGRRVTDVFAITVADHSGEANNESRHHFLNVRIDGADESAPAQAPAQQQPQQDVEIYSDDMSGGPSDDILPQNPEMI